MNIVKNRILFYIFSFFLVGGAIACLAVFGLKQGIDFTGGTMMSVRFENRPGALDVESKISEFNLGSITIQPVGDTDMNIRMKTIDEDVHISILEALNTNFGATTELQYNAIGPSVGVELRQKSMSALVIVFIAILCFIAYSFRKVSTPVQSWKYGLLVIMSSFHDVIIPIGLFALLGKFQNIEVGTPFIAAVLTIMGYSVNDTIVVLDRVRENLQKMSGAFEDIVEKSIKQTMLRSLNTSLTTILTLSAVYLFGGESIKYFALALIVGIITGTYSSIFVVSPALVTWYRLSRRKERK
ncbi:MAG: protein translocase subunit SecF [Patescibacteria group bacterium]